MHSVVRTVKAGSPLSKGIHSKSAHSNVATFLLPSKAITFHQPTHKAAVASLSTATHCSGTSTVAISAHRSLLWTNSKTWTQRLYSTNQSTSIAPGSPGTTSEVIQELERLLAKNDYEGFQKAYLAASANITKDIYHFSLKTLAEHPGAFATLSSLPSSTTLTNAASESASSHRAVPSDPINSAISILTDMSREANMGNTALQPDRETILLLLKVAGSKSSSSPETLQQGGEYAAWESVRVLVDAIRHGRLPAVMSSDQWELPDLNFELDKDLWKGMFECVHSSAAAVVAPGSGMKGGLLQQELDTMTFLMADQLGRSQDVVMDNQLWGYIIEAFGNARSASRLTSILPKLPVMDNASSGLYSTVSEALANSGLINQAMDIMSSLSTTLDTLPSVSPFVALARQHAKIGDYEAIRHDSKIWDDKGKSSPVNDSNLVNLHRSMLVASSVALDRIVNVVSKSFKDRQMSTLPPDVLPGMVTPPQLSRPQFLEATYLWVRSQESMNAIPLSERTPDDYDVLMRITTRLNLLQPNEWGLKAHAEKLITDMKQQGLKPLQSTYYTLMETIARTREYGASREAGGVAERVIKVFKDMTTQGGYTAKSAKDFRPMIEACFGIYSYSPFSAGQWMYSNQLYPASMSALKKVEDMMRDAIVPEADKSDDTSNGFSQFHDSITIASVLGGLGHGDKVEELLKRWENLPLEGVERDALLYQTFIGASFGQEKLARYVLRTARYDMLKEQPAVRMTPEIFTGLLNCCVRAQDAISARALIAQYSSSGDIKKTAEWYVPMVRTCLMVNGMEEEGAFLLQEMKTNNMRMDSFSGAFLEFLMEHFIMERTDYAAGREIFKDFVKSEQNEVEELLAARNRCNKVSQPPVTSQSDSQYIGSFKDGLEVKMISNGELNRRARRLQAPVGHWVERIEVAPKTASILNLLALSYIRERPTLLEHEKRSGFNAGSKERLREAQIVMHYLTGETKRHSRRAHASTANKEEERTKSPTIPDVETETPSQSISHTDSSSASESRSISSSLLRDSSSTLLCFPSEFGSAKEERDGHASTGRLIYVNKYILGEYIDMCIKEGSPEMIAEADWALNTIMPRVIGKASMPKDTQRLRQALDSARNKQYQQ
ncbi:hypothetical protein BGX26_009317 [Mortierella sp. AD094]|nr:hypothetical protein BGX26_009317 [Mortierella sp. AD094]